MKPFHLQMLVEPSAVALTCQWFGSSGIHAAGSLRFIIRLSASTQLIPAPYLIDLEPLLAEIAAGVISSAEDIASTDEFLLLRDLLEPDDLKTLTDALFRFLYQASQLERGDEPARSVRMGAKESVRVGADHNRRTVRVWYGTDRKPLGDDASEGFSAYQSGDEITYGVCHVFVPESHRPGSIGSSFWRRWWTGEDDRLKLQQMLALPREVFWDEIAATMRTWWREGERNVFVYIHGYNVDFEEAAIRAAQLGFDLKLPGEFAFFSWPSRGGAGDYLADEATITSSTPHLARFLHELGELSGAERIHLFVHSMGNRGLLNAFERVQMHGHAELKLGQVFFCAPDEDVRTFRDKTGTFPHRFERRTLLVSPDDKAVAASRWLHDQHRVGVVPPVPTFDGIETIEVGGFGILNLGHGYFGEAEPVIRDMREAIATGRSAAEREIPRPFENHFVIDVREATNGFDG